MLVKRFDFNPYGEEEHDRWEEHPDGEWVRVDDLMEAAKASPRLETGLTILLGHPQVIRESDASVTHGDGKGTDEAE